MVLSCPGLRVSSDAPAGSGSRQRKGNEDCRLPPQSSRGRRDLRRDSKHLLRLRLGAQRPERYGRRDAFSLDSFDRLVDEWFQTKRAGHGGRPPGGQPVFGNTLCVFLLDLGERRRFGLELETALGFGPPFGNGFF